MDAIEVKNFPDVGIITRFRVKIEQTDVFCVAFSQQWPTHLSQPEIQKQTDMVQSHNRFFAFDNISN